MSYVVALKLSNLGMTALRVPLGDKSGLALEKRRKQSQDAQLALVLLTDLAHNLLADFHHQALSDSPFSDFGPKRIVRDLLSIPGLLTFGDSQLQRIELWQNHPYAKSMLSCLQRLIETPTFCVK